MLHFFIGHASLIGEKSGKCVGFGIKSSHCKICSVAGSHKVTPKEHACTKNWKGSAKAMEPALACEMIQDVISQGHKVCTKNIYCRGMWDDFEKHIFISFHI